MIEHKSAEAADLFGGLLASGLTFFKKCCVFTLSVILMAFPLDEFFLGDAGRQRREVMGLSGDYLFVVFTAKPLRTSGTFISTK